MGRLKKSDRFLLGIVILLSGFTYFYRFGYPPNVYWDENYHIAAAQKYLNGVYFMEPHPPLGKLLIALGEKMVHPNAAHNEFLDSDYPRDFPKGFSFAGYRFFPALLSGWTAPLLFLILFLLLRSGFLAFCFTLPYVFDNAMIVHCRGAMIEGTMMFWIALMIFLFLLLIENPVREPRFRWLAAGMGGTFALLMTTKVTALVMILLVPAACWKLLPDGRRVRTFLKRFVAAFVFVYCLVWQIHFALSAKVNPKLPDHGYYQASAAYKEALDQGRAWNPLYFPWMLWDSWKFVGHYSRGVPRLDLCKEGENGSPFFLWPFGARAINYRWETPDGAHYRYLYLQCNPAGWLCGLAGVILSFVLLAGSAVFPVKKPPHHFLLATFFSLYAGYMLAMSQITRVMYLYHYLVPLFFSFILLALAMRDLQQVGLWVLTDTDKKVGAGLMGLAVFGTYLFFAPLTYYQLLTDAQFKSRMWISWWELRCIHGPFYSPWVVPKPAASSAR